MYSFPREFLVYYLLGVKHRVCIDTSSSIVIHVYTKLDAVHLLNQFIEAGYAAQYVIDYFPTAWLIRVPFSRI